MGAAPQPLCGREVCFCGDPLSLFLKYYRKPKMFYLFVCSFTEKFTPLWTGINHPLNSMATIVTIPEIFVSRSPDYVILYCLCCWCPCWWCCCCGCHCCYYYCHHCCTGLTWVFLQTTEDDDVGGISSVKCRPFILLRRRVECNYISRSPSVRLASEFRQRRVIIVCEIERAQS